MDSMCEGWFCSRQAGKEVKKAGVAVTQSWQRVLCTALHEGDERSEAESVRQRRVPVTSQALLPLSLCILAAVPRLQPSSRTVLNTTLRRPHSTCTALYNNNRSSERDVAYYILHLAIAITSHQAVLLSTSMLKIPNHKIRSQEYKSNVEGKEVWVYDLISEDLKLIMANFSIALFCVCQVNIFNFINILLTDRLLT